MEIQITTQFLGLVERVHSWWINRFDEGADETLAVLVEEIEAVRNFYRIEWIMKT